MSQRNRGRGSNRNNGSDIGEEVDLWKNCQTGLHNVVDIFNEHADNAQKIHDLDKIVASNKKAHSQGFQDTRNQLEQTIRAGVRMCERDKLSNQSSQLKELIEHLTVLKGIQEAKEKNSDPNPAPPSRTGSRLNRTERAEHKVKEDKDLYGDYEGALGSSPGPRMGKIGASSERGPKNDTRGGTPIPRVLSEGPESLPGSVGGDWGKNSSRTKITFAKDEEVAFRPKPTGSEQTDWILGIVQQVLGDGKSRRYKVLDPEPDDVTGKPKEYRTSASSMIPITSAANATPLPEWDNGKTVLALYPGTTTFYKAEVMITDDQGKVHLRFEGEENTTTMQMVERRYVVEYRG
ncbi:hypothetical protein MKZ38_003018 [Zalerion maritima]|uniref:SGF29 C-terminal domain-containing protein n=1 Tax=Zalerion maritima TaxID=339359 RepID=A0AAD5RNV9_9PEZI|nr:hypothetical protein MKZ38_003018 [Zalerion maritima]